MKNTIMAAVPKVLILILVEDSRRPVEITPAVEGTAVLILILVEDSRRLTKYKPYRKLL